MVHFHYWFQFDIVESSLRLVDMNHLKVYLNYISRVCTSQLSWLSLVRVVYWHESWLPSLILLFQKISNSSIHTSTVPLILNISLLLFLLVSLLDAEDGTLGDVTLIKLIGYLVHVSLWNFNQVYKQLTLPLYEVLRHYRVTPLLAACFWRVVGSASGGWLLVGDIFDFFRRHIFYIMFLNIFFIIEKPFMETYMSFFIFFY